MPRWSEGLGRKSFKSISCSGHYCKIFQKTWGKERLFLYRICWNQCAQTQILKVKLCFSTIHHEVIFSFWPWSCLVSSPYSKNYPLLSPDASQGLQKLVYFYCSWHQTLPTLITPSSQKRKRGGGIPAACSVVQTVQGRWNSHLKLQGPLTPPLPSECTQAFSQETSNGAMLLN